MLDLTKMIESLDRKINNITQVSSKSLQNISITREKQHPSKINLLITLIAAGFIVVIILLLMLKNSPSFDNNISHNNLADLANENDISALDNASLEIKPESFENSFITSQEAYRYIGENIRFCGKIVELIKFKKGVYINFDNKFPNQSITAVIWDNDTKVINIASGLYKKEVCIDGKIENYKNKPQVTIRSPSQISY